MVSIPGCRVCAGRLSTGSPYCQRCRRLVDRREGRRYPNGTRWPVDRRARVRAMRKQWDPDIGAFRCHYTNVPLTTDSGPRHITWEHRNPGQPSSVVLVAWLINDMKTDLSERAFKRMIHALDEHFLGITPFNQRTMPRTWSRGRPVAPVPATPVTAPVARAPSTPAAPLKRP
jgi:hypothetical protein